MPRRALFLAAVACAAAAVWAWWPRPDAPRHVAVTAAPPPALPEASPRLPSLPRSLRGTAIDGAYPVDAAGRLRPSPDVLRRFDYFLSTSGEEPLEVTRARIEADIRAELGPEAAEDALDLLARYLAYREAARELQASGLADDDLETRLQRVRELRRAHFGKGTAPLLFEEQDRLAEAALERARIESDPSLDEDERRRRLEGVEASLPEALAQARARALLPLELAREEAALRESGADADAVRHLRESRVGAEAAQRLAALDAARDRFARRLGAYRVERDALLASDPEGDLEALRAAHFAPHELPRVRGLDRIDGVDEPPAP